MLRTLMITKPLNPPWTDAAKNHARDIVLACPEVRFHLMTALGEPTFEAKNAKAEPLYTLPEPLPLYNKVKVFLRLLKPDESDLYHFFFTPNPATSLMGRLALGMKAHQKSAQTVCSRPSDHPKLKRMCFADRIVTVSNDTRDFLQNAGVEDITVIRPAVMQTDLPTALEIAETRRRFELPEDALLAMFAGDLEFSNAATTLAKALPALERHDQLHVIFCNRMKTPKARGIQKQLAQDIAALPHAKRIHIIPPQHDLNPLLRAIDILLLAPDTLYGKMDIPLVVLEALAHGKAAILSNLGPLTEIFADGEAGRIIPHSDAEALAEALIDLSENDARRAAMSAAAPSVIEKRFSMQRLAAEYTTFYQSFSSRTMP